jgi:cellulose synthase/poly-beta-1,6-N-acetylglucosamine synthase-like glycosyltransferase
MHALWRWSTRCARKKNNIRCPTITALAAPPNGETGWPWDIETPADSSSGPKITIVTPSYNQAGFLEQTIRSVLLQGYSNLEYIIIDGASSDGSVDIIRKYQQHLAYWVSEKDHGAADAIGKGFSKATGSICGWLNSDDFYRPAALQKVVAALQRNYASRFLSRRATLEVLRHLNVIAVGPAPLTKHIV